MATDPSRPLTSRWTLYVDEHFERDRELAQAFRESDLPGVVIPASGAPDVPSLVGRFESYRGSAAIAEFLHGRKAS